MRLPNWDGHFALYELWSSAEDAFLLPPAWPDLLSGHSWQAVPTFGRPEIAASGASNNADDSTIEGSSSSSRLPGSVNSSPLSVPSPLEESAQPEPIICVPAALWQTDSAEAASKGSEAPASEPPTRAAAPTRTRRGKFTSSATEEACSATQPRVRAPAAGSQASARDEIAAAVQDMLKTCSTLLRSDVDALVRQHLHAIHGMGGSSAVRRSLETVATAARRKKREEIRVWPAYIVTLLKSSFVEEKLRVKPSRPEAAPSGAI